MSAELAISPPEAGASTDSTMSPMRRRLTLAPGELESLGPRDPEGGQVLSDRKMDTALLQKMSVFGPQGPLPVLSGHTRYRSGSLASSASSASGSDDDSDSDEGGEGAPLSPRAELARFNAQRQAAKDAAKEADTDEVDLEAIAARAKRRAERRLMRLKKREEDDMLKQVIANRTRAQYLWSRLRRFARVMGVVFRLNSKVRDQSSPRVSAREVRDVLLLPPNFRQKHHVKTLVGFLKRLHVFQEMALTLGQLKELACAVQLKSFRTSDCTVYAENERSTCMYIVLTGFVSIRHRTPGEMLPFKELAQAAPGEVIGNDDVVLESGRFRPADAVTTGPVELACLRHDLTATILGGVQSTQTARLGEFLRSVSVFSSFRDWEYTTAAQIARLKHYSPGAVIVREGDVVDPLRLVMVVHRGIVEARKKHELTAFETSNRTSKFTRGVQGAVASSGLDELELLDPWGELSAAARAQLEAKGGKSKNGTVVLKSTTSRGWGLLRTSKNLLDSRSPLTTGRSRSRGTSPLPSTPASLSVSSGPSPTITPREHDPPRLTTMEPSKSALLTSLIGATLEAGDRPMDKVPPEDVAFVELGPASTLTSASEVVFAGEGQSAEDRVEKRYAATLVASTAVEMIEFSRTSLQARLSRETLLTIRSKLQNHLSDRDLTLLKNDSFRWKEYRQVTLEEKVRRYGQAAEEARHKAAVAPWERTVRTLGGGAKPGTAGTSRRGTATSGMSSPGSRSLPSLRTPKARSKGGKGSGTGGGGDLRSLAAGGSLHTRNGADVWTADSPTSASPSRGRAGDSLPAVSPMKRSTASRPQASPSPSLLRGRVGITSDKAFETHLDDVAADPSHIQLSTPDLRPTTAGAVSTPAYVPQMYIRSTFKADSTVRATLEAGFVENWANYDVHNLMTHVLSPPPGTSGAGPSESGGSVV